MKGEKKKGTGQTIRTVKKKKVPRKLKKKRTR